MPNGAGRARQSGEGRRLLEHGHRHGPPRRRHRARRALRQRGLQRGRSHRRQGRDRPHRAVTRCLQTQGERAGAGPDHVRDGRVDQREPQQHEHQHRREAHAFGEGADDQRRGDDGEGHLEGDEHAFREGADHAFLGEVPEESVLEAPDEGGQVHRAGLHAGGVEGQAVAEDHPGHRNQAGDGKTLHQHRQDVLRAHHAAVEQGQAGDDHEQHQGRGGEHPGGVARVDGRRGRRAGKGEKRQQGNHGQGLRGRGKGFDAGTPEPCPPRGD